MKFAMLLNGAESEFEPASPEEGEAAMRELYAWFEKWGAAGKIADSGVHLQPTSTAKTISAGRNVTVQANASRARLGFPDLGPAV